jgi:hypothetical protein
MLELTVVAEEAMSGFPVGYRKRRSPYPITEVGGAAMTKENPVSQKPSLTLVKVGLEGLTLEQTLRLFTKLSGRDATEAEIGELKAKMARRGSQARRTT